MTDALVARALALLDRRERVIIGIAGCPGAGKSTVAEWLVGRLSAAVPTAWVPMDGYHLADSELIRLGRLGSKGAIETFDAHGYLSTLRRIRVETDNIVYAPEFDRSIEQPISGGMPVLPGTRIVVTEGNYLLDESAPWDRIRSELDEAWYVDIGDETRRARLVARHERFGKPHAEAVAWVDDVDEVNARRISATRHRANLVIGPDDISLTPVPVTAPPGEMLR